MNDQTTPRVERAAEAWTRATGLPLGAEGSPTRDAILAALAAAGPTAAATVTAAAIVLWGHGWQSPGPDGPRFRCRCGGWAGDLLGPGGFTQHQADALAAGGLLVTPERDALPGCTGEPGV